MIDGTIPEQMHEKYLKVVLNETERLTKLTNGLLTLNNLNMTGMVLEKSIFDINQVIKSVVESFEGTGSFWHAQNANAPQSKSKNAFFIKILNRLYRSLSPSSYVKLDKAGLLTAPGAAPSRTCVQ